MKPEITILVASIFGLTILGMIAIIAILILRPHDDNTQLISTIIGFLLPTILSFVAAFKGIQNSGSLEVLKEQGNGNLEHAVKQAAAVASLTEQVASVKEAAAVAAKTSVETAAALAEKKAGTS